MDRLTDEISSFHAIHRPLLTPTMDKPAILCRDLKGRGEWSLEISKISPLPSQLIPDLDRLTEVALPKESSLCTEENRAA
jgi:hypothetical protein